MRTGRKALRPLLVTLVLAACTSEPRYTQAQLNAIETRLVEAGFDEAYDAASGALFDAGYIIAMSDREGGLITGRQVKTPTGWEAFWGTSLPRELDLSIQVRESGPDESKVRIKVAVNGRATVDRQVIDEIWVLMQRQVLMFEPPSLPPEDDAPQGG